MPPLLSNNLDVGCWLNVSRDRCRSRSGTSCNAYGFVALRILCAYPLTHRALRHAPREIVITCGEERFADGENDILLNPLVIIEVLSDSTEEYDRGKKFENYQSIESLREYLLVSQNSQRVEQFVKQNEKNWMYSETHEAGESIKIQSIECELKLEDIYLKVE